MASLKRNGMEYGIGLDIQVLQNTLSEIFHQVIFRTPIQYALILHASLLWVMKEPLRLCLQMHSYHVD